MRRAPFPASGASSFEKPQRLAIRTRPGRRAAGRPAVLPRAEERRTRLCARGAAKRLLLGEPMAGRTPPRSGTWRASFAPRDARSGQIGQPCRRPAPCHRPQAQLDHGHRRPVGPVRPAGRSRPCPFRQRPGVHRQDRARLGSPRSGPGPPSSNRARHGRTVIARASTPSSETNC